MDATTTSTANKKPAPLPPFDERSDAAWRPLTPVDRWALAGLVVVLVVSAVPRTPPGVCFEDAGELQVAASAGGLIHPPGYGGYIAVARPLVLVPLLEPAYRVTLLAMASAVTALTLLALLLSRLGLSSFIAGIFALVLTWNPGVWLNLVTPEVYAPSWALLAAGVYFAARHARFARRHDLILSGLAFRLLIANRPPALLYLPFMMLAWGIAIPRGTFPRRLSVCAIGLLATLPGIALTLGYVWHADSTQTAYNYVEHYNAEMRTLPELDDGPAGKWTRMWWLISGQQFSYNLRLDAQTAKRQARRVSEQFLDARVVIPWPVERVFDARFLVALPVFILMLAGSIVLWRDQPAVLILGWGIVLGGAAYLLAYEVAGQAADILPVLLGVSILVGSALPILARRSARARRPWPAVLFGIVGVASMLNLPPRPDSATRVRADRFLGELDMASLPPDSVVCTVALTTGALWYEKVVVTGRNDITIISGLASSWERLIADQLHRPVFYAAGGPPPDGWTIEPYRNIGRLVPYVQAADR